MGGPRKILKTAVILLLAGCGDLSAPIENLKLNPEEIASLNKNGEYPDSLQLASEVDTAFFQWMDENDTWIKARMPSTYSSKTLQENIERLCQEKYSTFHFSTFETSLSRNTEVLPGIAEDWPSLPSNAPSWWNPPSALGNATGCLFGKQLEFESKEHEDVATGLYILYSDDLKTLWLWKWTMQHVELMSP